MRKNYSDQSDLSRSDFIDQDNRTVRIALTSEQPVRRPFGWEILDHSQESIDMDFIGQARSPLLLDHDMTKVIGIIEDFQLDESSKRTLAQVRFGKSALADEIWQDVKDGIQKQCFCWLFNYKYGKRSRG